MSVLYSNHKISTRPNLATTLTATSYTCFSKMLLYVVVMQQILRPMVQRLYVGS